MPGFLCSPNVPCLARLARKVRAPVSVTLEEPTIPPRLRRPLAAAWVSLGLHGALIALVQVAPPASVSLGEPVIEARLVSTHVASPAKAVPPPEPEVVVPEAIAEPPPAKVPLLAPSVTAEPMPVSKPVTPLPVRPAPPAPSAPPQPVVATPAEPVSEPVSAPPQAPAPTPAATITSSVDLNYYSAREVDVHPRALHKIEPEYPYAADRQRLSGKVRLQLRLEADGRISDVDVVSAVPPGMFEEASVKAFRSARFAPAQRQGRPVRALVVIEVVFDWEGQTR